MLIVLLLTAIVNVALACFVLLKNIREWTNRLFAVVATSVAGWTLGICLATQVSSSLPLFLTARFTFAMAATAVYTLLLLFESLTCRPSFPVSGPVIVFGVLTVWRCRPDHIRAPVSRLRNVLACLRGDKHLQEPFSTQVHPWSVEISIDLPGARPPVPRPARSRHEPTSAAGLPSIESESIRSALQPAHDCCHRSRNSQASPDGYACCREKGSCLFRGFRHGRTGSECSHNSR